METTARSAKTFSKLYFAAAAAAAIKLEFFIK